MAHFAAWYRREDYERIREIMDDRHKMPVSFDQWEEKAKRAIASALTQGIVLKPFIIDPEKFLAFCNERNIPKGLEARGMFTMERGLAQDMN